MAVSKISFLVTLCIGFQLALAGEFKQGVKKADGQNTQLFVMDTFHNTVTEVIDLSGSDSSICHRPARYPQREHQAPVGTLVGSNPFVCGGYDNLQCQELDVDQDVWSNTYNLSEYRAFSASARYGWDQWWITGGEGGGSSVKTTTLFTPGKGFTEHFELPQPYQRHCLVQINETHYFLTGGLHEGLDLNKDTYIFNTMDETWTKVPPLPDYPMLYRYDFACGLVETGEGALEVVVAAGSPLAGKTQIFSLDDLSWREGPGFPVLGGYGFASVPMGNTFLVVGGFDSQTLLPMDTIYQFDGVNEQWVELPQRLSKGSQYPVAFFLRDDTYNCNSDKN